MGALDRLAKLKRPKLKEPELDYVRVEKDGWVIYKKGETEIKVNPAIDYKHALIKLLEQAGGNAESQVVLDFWNRQSEKLLAAPDEMHSRALQDIYDRLSKAWEEIYTPPAVDFFAELD